MIRFITHKFMQILSPKTGGYWEFNFIKFMHELIGSF